MSRFLSLGKRKETWIRSDLLPARRGCFAPLGVHCGSMRCVVCGVGGWVSFVGHCVRYAGVRTSEIRWTASAAFLLELEHLVF